ncbi:MAG TPA: hypothetical protein VIK77_03805 [Tissierellaceae bacterium]|mgnify:CR=1 FL=1
MKLRTRLLTIISLVSLIPLVIFSTVTVSTFISKSIKDTYEMNNNKLEMAESEINKILEKNLNTLYTLASQPAIKNFEYDTAKKILVNAAEINPELVFALDNVSGDQ